MGDHQLPKYRSRRGAASFRSLSDIESSLHLRCSRGHTIDEGPVDGNDSELSCLVKEEHVSDDQAKEAVHSEECFRPIRGRASYPNHGDEHAYGDILLGDKDEESNDEPAVLTTSAMPAAESLISDEELHQDKLKDFNNQDKGSKPEVWRSEWHKKHIAAICSEKFDSLLKMFPHFQGCKSHMAAFVLMREVLDTTGHPRQLYKVVAQGTGRSSCSKWLCFNGTMVHDCHAVVIARRALLRFLYKQLLLFFGADPNAEENCIFESGAASPQLQLKSKISLHLYTNHCLKGADGNLYFEGSTNNLWMVMKLQYHNKGLLVPVAYLDPSHWAARVCCVAGTDKLCSWTVTGVQGALLSHFIRPLYITSVVLGGQKLISKEVSDITNKRLGDGWEDSLPPLYKKHNIVFLYGDHTVPVVTSTQTQNDDLSINWCLGDSDIEVLDSGTGFIVDGSPFVSGPGFSSRLCKRALYSYFLRVAQQGGHSCLLELSSYHKVKMEAIGYQEAKELVKQQLLKIQAGPWKSKKLVDCFSV